MTDEQREQWRRERDIARQIPDQLSRDAALMKVYDHRDDLMMECIAHQGARGKLALEKIDKLDGRVGVIEEKVAPLEATAKDYRENKIRGEGMIILWRLIRYAVACGGGALLVKLAAAANGGQ